MRLALRTALFLAAIAALDVGAQACPQCEGLWASIRMLERFSENPGKTIEDRRARRESLMQKQFAHDFPEDKNKRPPGLTPAERAELESLPADISTLEAQQAEAQRATADALASLRKQYDICMTRCRGRGREYVQGVLMQVPDPAAALPEVPRSNCIECDGVEITAISRRAAARKAAEFLHSLDKTIRELELYEANPELFVPRGSGDPWTNPAYRKGLLANTRAERAEAQKELEKLRAELDQAIAELEACNRKCRTPRRYVPPAGTGGVLPPKSPAIEPLPPPPKPPATAPLPPPAPGGFQTRSATGLPFTPVAPSGRNPFVEIPAARCPQCEDVRAEAVEWQREIAYLDDLVAEDEFSLRVLDAVDRGDAPKSPTSDAFRGMSPTQRSGLRERIQDSIRRNRLDAQDAQAALDSTLEDLAECNQACGAQAPPRRAVGVGGGPRAPAPFYPGPDFVVPDVVAPLCPACAAAARQAQEIRSVVQATALVLMLSRPPVPAPYVQLRRQLDALAEANARVYACNYMCVAALTNPVLITVINITGVNPFDPSNPIGVAGGPSQPPPPSQGPATVQFSSASYGGAEGGAVAVTVVRGGDASGTISVDYVASTRTATEGSDFAPARGTLTWGPGDRSPRTFSVALIDDSVVEPTEIVDLSLANPQGAAFAEPSRATISIADNDSAPPQPAGSLQFSASTFSAAEGQGSATITVTRAGGSAGSVSVNFLTGPSSATAGADYQAVSGTLTWAAGDTGAKTFTVPIVDDTLVEGAETFFVTLNNASGGATLGNPATATVTIADNDVASGPCGAQGHAWQQNPGNYTCSGNCDPTPGNAALAINGMQVTVSPFHALGAATFTGCTASLNSDRNDLTYFGQANHRATITRSSNTAFTANIVSSGGGTCFFSCSRPGP